ncbi:type II secretion system protein GspM [Rivibacter subsaxonicus]|uniref:General secretion pathway protein M n=1 Tax=Rivibacter subsaxonicus TaxID=457575 RepID=A0A4Q7VZ42_9BURK|nr:type II secretion system protein GspM [Rivibacter subsaxonicus]RZU02047.1 general secretion pathway protein M [Rivibacter subsaxonicus]
MSWQAQLGQKLAPLRARWRALAPRERLWVAMAAGVVGTFVLWLVAVQPAWRTLRTAPAQIDALDAQLQHMQRLAGEARELRAQPVVSPAQAEAALRASTERLGSDNRLTLQGDRATVQLKSVPGPALGTWLAEVRSAARARPVEVTLVRGPAGYSGTVVLALGGRA